MTIIAEEHCPMCNSENIDTYDTEEWEAECMLYRRCRGCKAEWISVFMLTKKIDIKKG